MFERAIANQRRVFSLTFHLALNLNSLSSRKQSCLSLASPENQRPNEEEMFCGAVPIVIQSSNSSASCLYAVHANTARQSGEIFLSLRLLPINLASVTMNQQTFSCGHRQGCCVWAARSMDTPLRKEGSLIVTSGMRKTRCSPTRGAK